MESERSNKIAPQNQLTIEEEIFGPQYRDILNGSITNHGNQPPHQAIHKHNPKHVLCVMNPIHYSNLMELTWKQSRDCPVFMASILDALLFF